MDSQNRKTMTAKRQLQSPEENHVSSKKMSTEVLTSTQEALQNMVDEDSDLEPSDSSKDDDLILVNPKVINNLMSTIQKLSKTVESLSKNVCDIKKEVLIVKKTNSELVELLKEKDSESGHPSIDERSTILNWGRTFHARRSEYMKYYKDSEKSKILKSFIEGDDPYITRKHRVKFYNSEEEFRLKEKLAISSIKMESDILAMNANKHKEAFVRYDQEMNNLIDETDKSDAIKENLKKRWCDETKKAETKAKELSSRNINFMMNLPRQFPYEGYIENADSSTVTNEEIILERTITNTDATSKSKKFPQVKSDKGKTKTGGATNYKPPSGGASNYPKNGNNKNSTYNLRQKNTENNSTGGRYYSNDEYYSRDYGRRRQDEGFQQQRKKNNNKRNFQKGTGLNPPHSEEMEF